MKMKLTRFKATGSELQTLALTVTVTVTAALVFGANNIQQVQCSSYLDNYFMPTARLALNKIQQSLSPVIGNQDNNQQASSPAAATAETTTQVENLTTPQAFTEQRVTSEAAQTVQEPATSQEPGKGEFVKLELAEPPKTAEPPALTVSSSSSAESDPTVSTEIEPATSEAGAESTSTVASSSTSSSESPAVAGQAADSTSTAKSPEDSVRETELEAVAAVDASIGFGADMFASMSDSCYDEYGNARFCEPEFENVAFERQVEVSSECGSPASRFCTAFLNEAGDQRRNCHICDAHNPKKRHPASYLTDMNNSNEPTCWVSAPIGATLALANATNEPQPPLAPKLDNVTLVLNLDKKYEIVYISMQFCSLKPDSLAIHKSSDFGQTWTPFQFYSSQCRRTYGRPAGKQQGRADKPEAQCVNSTTSGGPGSGRVAFSPQEERSSAAAAVERSAEWHEWITATNIKITLDRHHPNWILSSLVNPHGHHHHQHNHLQQQRLRRSSSANGSQETTETGGEQLTNPSDTFNYAMSDLSVGGRCKCNGHASRCVLAKDNRLQCDCRHNTAGRDCDRCAPFHFDRPWARATQLDANPCQPCNCNGHSRKCKFDAELYRLSGKRSGGVCFGCRDNTAGRFCHYCKEGFTRDHTKAISDKEVCKHCECHPIGSLGRVCNITTGQCPCKEGVTGLQCNRCAPGYQQSSSPTEPCIKLPENDINWQLTVDGSEQAASTSEHQQPVESAAPDAAPPGGQKPDLDATTRPVEQPIDKDNDESSDPTEAADNVPPPPPPPPPPRKKQRPNQWAQPNQRNTKQPHYTRFHATRTRYQFANEPQLIGDHDPELEPADEDLLSDSYGARNMYYPQQQPHYYAPKPKQRFHQQRRLPPGQQGGRYMLQPFDEPSPIEDLNSLDEPQQDNLPSYMHAAQTNSLYPDENFNNQIQAPRRVQQKMRQGSGARRQQLAGYEPAAELAAPATSNELSCGDCQLTSRKMSMRQFCHLEFAIKANILSKQVAEDWTKFEVDIQDIFKSPGADSLLRAGANYIDSLVQAATELENGEERNRTAVQSSADGAAEQVAGPPAPVGGHRIKVGSVQSIWVPTEDLACKCPRLRLRSTYLLMGSVDLRENSANTLQLDRHGVALEWESSLQKKLLRYQRRQSRGKC